MIEKEHRKKQGNYEWRINSTTSSSSHVVEHFDNERTAQREEFLRREKERNNVPSPKFRSKKPGKTTKPKVFSFDQRLEMTYQWLEETFPHLFCADDYVLLDNFILRDLKIEYKNNVLKKRYPPDLVIKAAISRYKESLGYLERVKAGVARYNIKGEPCEIVTKEEEKSAQRIISTSSSVSLK